VESLLEHHHPESIVKNVSSDSDSGEKRLRPEVPSESGLTVRPFYVTRLTWAILAAVFLSGLGLWVENRLEDTLLRHTASELKSVLDGNVSTMETWIEQQSLQLERFVRDPRYLGLSGMILDLGEGGESTIDALRQAPERQAFAELWGQYWQGVPTAGGALFNGSGFVVSSPSGAMIGGTVKPVFAHYYSKALGGQTVYVRPIRDIDTIQAATPGYGGTMYTGFLTPVRNSLDKVVGVQSIAFRAYDEFSLLIETALGETGETYAFDDRGLMLTKSRFTEELRELNLIPALDDPANAWDRSTQLNLQVRDPGGDLAKGHVPEMALEARPLTKLAALAIASRNQRESADLEGVVRTPYRNYRGAEVIGAWRWLGEHDFAMATEIELEEALFPLRYLNITFGVLFAILTVFVAATLVQSFKVRRLRRRVRGLRRLGQYTLLEPIAQGGMGTVYLAEHAMLKRPTAVKTLSEEKLSPESLVRFEREVQLASQLTHPNTIEIYDYGRTPEDVFYYAMEYVEGLNLADLVARYGEMPPARVAHILRQVCSSLGEAHRKGLIHRDIKPSNIMLCERGGDFDVVKVLDFGLVKNVARPQHTEITKKTQIGGTPLYMAPERLTDQNAVDARSDIYSLAAVTYHLLAAQPIHQYTSDVDLLYKVVNAEPEPLATVAKQSILDELAQLVMKCLSKEPEARPQSVFEVLERLESVPGLAEWTQADAVGWWQKNVPTQAA
jgi:hypothetical protein